MKKLCLLSALILNLSSMLFAALPENLKGIWEGKDRYVFFEDDENNKPQIVIVLKTYYGWYLDRYAEDKIYGEKAPRDRNNATPGKPVYVSPDFQVIYEDEKSGNYEAHLQYARHNENYIPFCLINDRIYLEFWEQSSRNPDFWCGHPVSDGFTVSEQRTLQKFNSWYIDEQGSEFYRIPFWRCNMDLDTETPAMLNSFEIDRHIYTAQTVYTCVAGRRVNVRNLQKADAPFDAKKMVTSEAGNLTATDSPYLIRLADKSSFEDLVEIVRSQNSRKKPPAPSPFPEEELDYHWDIIDLLESNNRIIQALRQRQKDFGIRGKDYGR